METVFTAIAMIAVAGLFMVTAPAPSGCEDDHVPFRQVTAAILGVGAGGPEIIDGGDYVILSLFGVAFPVLALRNAELLIEKRRGKGAGIYVRWLSYVLVPATGYFVATSF